jgi:hypothetical protein
MGDRCKDWIWTVSKNHDGKHYSMEAATLTVLLDLRDELKRLNTLLHCSNFVAMPAILRRISRNTAKKRKPRVIGKPKLRVVR